MKIIDSRWEGQHGIGRFALEVGRRLVGYERISLRGTPTDALDPLRLTRYLRSRRPDLYFSPGYNVPVGVPCPFVVCVHDLNHLVVKENSSFMKRAYYEYLLKPALLRSRLVLTVSDFTRKSICSWSGLPESRVLNVGNGVSDVFSPSLIVPDGSRGRYFLYVGNQKPHKNFIRLLKAFALSGVEDHTLISTGVSGPLIDQMVVSLNLHGRVLFVGNVLDHELATLYRGATALVLVSLYEGFGLPLVESMACGTPVLTSNVSAMPGVIGGAGLQVDPRNVAEISDALRMLASDSQLRKRLRTHGLQRARFFSWDATALLVNEALSACA